MILSKERQGDLFILSEGALWGLFPVVIVLSYNTVSPLISLTISSLFAAIFFAIIITIKKTWHQLQNKSAYKDILLAALIRGVIFYLLYFFALKSTSPGNASIVALTQVFFSFLFFHVFKKEYIPKTHVLGALLMVSGALIVLSPNLKSFQPGDLLILLGAAIVPFGDLFTQKARKKVDSETILLIRSTVSGIVIFIIAFSFRTQISFPAIQDSLLFLAINGCLLLGLSKILWINGIHRISITKANAISSISPFFTLIFALMFLKQIPTMWQFLSIAPICAGVILLSRNKTSPPTLPEAD